MPRYRIVHEIWKTDGIYDFENYNPYEDFFGYATDNLNGSEFDEEIKSFDSKEEALEELSKYKCTYEAWEDYHQARYNLYALEEVAYGENNEIEDYNFIKYADVDI
ncbi:MAG: hypothetical protein IJ740_08285 [Ruminococcus sp.]|nr:hypothetical protein [Ruminococcus sp.]